MVDRLGDLIDECENDFEALVFNPDGTFEFYTNSNSINYFNHNFYVYICGCICDVATR
ncbi:hypothetical protein [Streptococcus phocae]